MAVTFVLGRAGSGKTRHCVDALLSALDQSAENSTLILLVPEQASFQMERTLATRCARSGYCRAAVLSFSRLAQRALADLGLERGLVSTAGREMALRCAALRMGGALRFHRAAARTQGFYGQLARLIEELLREQVTPRQLAACAQPLTDRAARQKVAEVARLYDEYLQWLGPQRADPAQRLELVRERLAELPWLRGACVWVDGFAGFTGQELATLAALAKQARDLAITLLLDPAASRPDLTPDPLDLFARTQVTYQRLLRLFADAGVECRRPIMLAGGPPPRFAGARALARLEAGLATPIGVPPGVSGAVVPHPAEQVRVLECATHRDELRQAARFIRQALVESGGALHFRDFAVIARDLEPLASLVAEVFTEFEIPYFLDRRRPMRAHPLSRLVEALLSAAREDFSVAATTRLLRTGLLPLTRDQAEQLENTVAVHAVHGAEAWRQPVWVFDREPFQAAEEAVAQDRAPDRSAAGTGLDVARRQLMAAVEPLLNMLLAPAPHSGAAWAKSLYGELEALGVRRRMEDWVAECRHERGWERAEIHRLAWEALCTVLTELHDVLGGTPLAAGEVAGIVGSALREQTLGLAPPALDEVLVSAIERSRHPDIKYAWVCAFNEGVFPARPAEDELLTTAERDALARHGLPAPASHRDEAFGERLLAYIALTRPSCGLTISYATVGADGGPLLPSPLLDDLRRALPGLAVERPDPHEPPTSLAELAREHLYARPRAAGLPRAWQRYEHLCEWARGQAADADRLNWLLRGVSYRNAAEVVGSYRPTGEAGAAWSGSPSEVETYLDCSFKHFAQYGLALDPQRRPRPALWDLGSAAHAIIADATRRARGDPRGARGLSDDDWRAVLRQSVADFRAALPPDLPQRRPELVFLSEHLEAFLAELVLAHGERWRHGEFEPLACEQAFAGRGGAPGWPALAWELDDGRRVELRGKIDRVDACRAGGRFWLLVYDYKTSVSPVAGRYLTGARLQLFSYLLAAQHALREERDLVVAGVFLAPLYPDARMLDYQYVQAAEPDVQRMYLYRPRGLFVGEAAERLDAQLGQTPSPVAAMKRRKDGGFDRAASRDVVMPEEIGQRLALARQTVLLAVEGIVGGKVAAAPLVENRRLACERCDFRPVCRFDRALNPVRAAEVSLPQLPERPAGEDAP